MKTQYIYLARHGETDANKNGIYQGIGLNQSLNQAGKPQVELLGKFLRKRKVNIAAIYTSPTQRTLETASILAHILSKPGMENAEGIAQPEIIIEQNLHEIDHGDWDGKTFQEVQNLHPDMIELWWSSNPMSLQFPNGEKVSKARTRILNAFDRMRKKNTEKNIMVVAHGGTNSMWLSSIFGSKKFRCIKQDNSCLNIVESAHDQLKITLLNSTAHLL